MPLVVWLIHGSIDWFWEMPALSGPALGGLAHRSLAGHRPRPRASPSAAASPSPSVAAAAGVAGRIARRRSPPRCCWAPATCRPGRSRWRPMCASPTRRPRCMTSQPPRDSIRSAPLPGRLAGTIALQNSEYTVAQQRFRQSIEREPGGWFSWLGAGLAASGLGQTSRAERDFRVALSINRRQPAIGAGAPARAHKKPLDVRRGVQTTCVDPMNHLPVRTSRLRFSTVLVYALRGNVLGQGCPDGSPYPDKHQKGLTRG